MGKINLYRNISITFVVFTAMILCTLFLTFYSQATIIITPDPQIVNLNFNAEVRTSSTDEEIKKLDALKGEIYFSEVEATGTFDVLSTKTTSGFSENIVGKVKIKNDGKVGQTLVRTTQLQATDGTIVRTNRQIFIPAGGEIEVDVFPKDPKTFSKLPAGKLVIIKLPVAMQELVYGQADNELSFKSQTGEEVKFLAESDVNRAKKEIIEKTIAETISNNGGKNSNILGEIISYSLDKKIGEETDKFTMTAKIRLKTININPNQLVEAVIKKAHNINQSGLTTAAIDPEKIRYAIVNANSSESYNIKISYPLTTELAEENELLSKDNFAGKTKQEIQDYAVKTDAIKEIEVVISPYWRKTTPKDVNRIKIIIK